MDLRNIGFKKFRILEQTRKTREGEFCLEFLGN